jgi:hypothetical protein
MQACGPSTQTCARRTTIAKALALAGVTFTAPSVSLAFTNWVVNSCDDSSNAASTVGTLRYSIVSAATGDVIDMSNLRSICPKITLNEQIVIQQDVLTLKGPAEGTEEISIKRHTDRLFTHVGSGNVYINNLAIDGGYVESSSGPALGGCLFSHSGIWPTSSTVSGCSAISEGTFKAAGGAIYANYIRTSYSSFSDNRASGYGSGNALGGAVFATGRINNSVGSFLSNATYSRSHADTGGAIYSTGSSYTSLYSSVVARNSSSFSAIWVGGAPKSAPVLITDSTISGNTSTGTAGIVSYQPMTIANSTIAFNSSVNNVAAGIFAYSTLDLESTIAANNTSAASQENLFDVQTTGSAVTGSRNLVTSGASPIGTITTCPLLRPLQYNGGPTLTHAIPAISPAIDVGDNLFGNYYDQRLKGFVRSFGVAPDIGAYEWQGEADDFIFSGQFENRCM